MSFLQLAGLWFRSRILRDRAARWNHQYAVGRWDKLKAPEEQARFAATARLLVRHVPPGHVLEIGCGESLLLQRLKPTDYRSWLGVDISEIAIQRAQAFAREHVHYVVADMETMTPDGMFDAIVFTESIYYSTDCARLLRRFSRCLNPKGLFVVSICRTKRSARVWEAIHAVVGVVATAATINEQEIWDCEVLTRTEPQAT